MIKELLANYPLICGICAWTICQLMKYFTSGIRAGQWNYRYLWAAGGMPSSHSASVTAVTIAIGLRDGFASSLFAISVVFSCIVMYDAAGVRRETGKQGKIINEILRWPEVIKDDAPSGDLKERVGHSPLEVIAGVAAGIVCALVFRLFYGV